MKLIQNIHLVKVGHKKINTHTKKDGKFQTSLQNHISQTRWRRHSGYIYIKYTLLIVTSFHPVLPLTDVLHHSQHFIASSSSGSLGGIDLFLLKDKNRIFENLFFLSVQALKLWYRRRMRKLCWPTYCRCRKKMIPHTMKNRITPIKLMQTVLRSPPNGETKTQSAKMISLASIPSHETSPSKITNLLIATMEWILQRSSKSVYSKITLSFRLNEYLTL